jgi:hypothetical protein
MADTMVLPVAERLLSCLCELLADTVGGPVCFCCLVPGQAPPPNDFCCGCKEGSEGQATVQIGPIFPTTRFPAEGVSEVKNCRSFEWGVELIMTVYRCLPTLDSSGNAPSCEQQTAAVAKIADDAQAMMAAVMCCDWNTDGLQIVPGRWTPLPNLGGCGGGTMSVKVLLGSKCCPT